MALNICQLRAKQFGKVVTKDWVCDNNTRNVNTDNTLFKHNCGYYPKVLFEENVDLCSRSHSTNKLAEWLRELV